MTGEAKYSITKLEKAGEYELRITWNDGVVSSYNTAALRRACPCASCVHEWTGEALLDPLSVLETVKPVRIEPVGRYALRFTWSDRHDTGLYTFDFLRDLAEPKNASEKNE